MATPAVPDEEDAFVLDEGLNDADDELVAFGVSDKGAGVQLDGGGAHEAGATTGGARLGAAKDPPPAGAPAATSATGLTAGGGGDHRNGGSAAATAGNSAVAGDVAAAATAADTPPGSLLYSLVVSNVGGDANTEELLEILGCCGALSGSAFAPLTDGTQVGLALFAEAEAVEAALTLDGSRFQGRTLTVVQEAPTTGTVTTPAAALAQLPALVRRHEVARASVAAGGGVAAAASAAAAGVPDLSAASATLMRSVSVVGEESRKLAERIQHARLTRAAAASAADAAAATRRAWADVDAEYHVTDRVSAARTSAGETVANVDAQLHVSERVGEAVTVLRRGAGDLDASLGVTSGLSAMAASVGGATRKIAGEVDETWNVSTRARVAAATALENESVRSVWATWSSWVAPLSGGSSSAAPPPQRRPSRAPAPPGSRGEGGDGAGARPPAAGAAERQEP